MRTVLIIFGGFILWGVCLAIARFVAQSTPTALTAATVVFVALWFVAAVANMWAGVMRAGYSVAEELPIFLLIFLAPSVVAGVVRWKLL